MVNIPKSCKTHKSEPRHGTVLAPTGHWDFYECLSFCVMFVVTSTTATQTGWKFIIHPGLTGFRDNFHGNPFAVSYWFHLTSTTQVLWETMTPLTTPLLIYIPTGHMHLPSDLPLPATHVLLARGVWVSPEGTTSQSQPVDSSCGLKKVTKYLAYKREFGPLGPHSFCQTTSLCQAGTKAATTYVFISKCIFLSYRTILGHTRTFVDTCPVE